MLPFSCNNKRKNSGIYRMYNRNISNNYLCLWCKQLLYKSKNSSNICFTIILCMVLFLSLCVIWMRNLQFSQVSNTLRDSIHYPSSNNKFIKLNKMIRTDQNSNRLLPTIMELNLDPTTIPTSFSIGLIADLDKKSIKEKNSYQSIFLRGKLTRNYKDNNTLLNGILSAYTTCNIIWEEPELFDTKLNEGGRGFELSELKWFNGKLYTFDDRTGIVYELQNFGGLGIQQYKHISALPAYVINEGNGMMSSKGQKNEWATVKNNELYIGSIGKEYTNNKGEILSDSNFWIAIINKNGNIRHINWEKNYHLIRKALKCEYPGYVIHEAIEWSDIHKLWFILPRRISSEPYDEVNDEKKGSNLLVIANEDFSKIEIRTFGHLIPEHGFSSFKFMPNTKDTVIVAIKSVEDEKLDKQETYLLVMDIEGNIILDETMIPYHYKFEGFVFTVDWTPRKAVNDI